MPGRPMAFMSYAHIDNSYGQLTEFRERLSTEVHIQTGAEFPIFQDRDDILFGQPWRQRIERALHDEVTFLIPIITPSFFKSTPCREELTLFQEREIELGRDDLIFPVYFVDCPVLTDPARRSGDELAELIASRQWADWRGLRFEPFSSQAAAKALMQFASGIAAALDRASSNIVTAPQAVMPSHFPRIFMIYAHQDERFRVELEHHLGSLRSADVIAPWSFRSLRSGFDADLDTRSEIESAEIILLLVSAYFLASDYAFGPELKRAIERHDSGEATVIPIIVRACDWGGTPFAKFQVLPQNAKPITAWRNRDAAFAQIAREIARIAAKH